MYSFRHAAIAVVACLLFSSAVRANTIGVTTLDGSQPGIGHDPDKPAPTVTAEGFYAQGTTGQYNSVRFTAAGIGMAGLTLGDILSISYDHKQAGGGLDWQMKVYTESSPSTGSGWYGYRLNYDLSTANADGTWATFTDTNAGAERIKAYNNPANIYRANDASGFASALAAASSQKVLFFDISAGASSGGWNYDTFLNNITVNTASFGSATLQAQVAVVPVPAALPAGLALLGAYGLKRKFGNRKTA